jgi:hypothetical protein
MFKFKITPDRHNGRQNLNYCILPHTAHFSLPSTFNGVPGLAGCPVCCCWFHYTCKLPCLSGVSICVGSPVVAFIPVVAGVPLVYDVLTVAGVPDIVGFPTIAFTLLLLAFLL